MIWSQLWKCICYVLILWDKVNIVYGDVIKCGFSQQKSDINQRSTIKPVKSNQHITSLQHLYHKKNMKKKTFLNSIHYNY